MAKSVSKNQSRLTVVMQDTYLAKLEQISQETGISKNAIMVALLAHPPASEVKRVVQAAVEFGTISPMPTAGKLELRKKLQALPADKLARALELLEQEGQG